MIPGVDDTLLVGIGGIILAALTYFAGKRGQRRQDRASRKHDLDMEGDRRLHERSTHFVNQYVDLVRSSKDAGLSAMRKLGLQLLETDPRIRTAIAEMEGRTGRDPWQGSKQFVENCDLVVFFQYCHDHNVKFHHTSVEEVARAARGAPESPDDAPA